MSRTEQTEHVLHSPQTYPSPFKEVFEVIFKCFLDFDKYGKRKHSLENTVIYSPFYCIKVSPTTPSIHPSVYHSAIHLSECFSSIFFPHSGFCRFHVFSETPVNVRLSVCVIVFSSSSSPRPGSLKRGMTLAIDETTMKRSRTSSISSGTGAHAARGTPGTRRNAIQSSYSSSIGLSQVQHCHHSRDTGFSLQLFLNRGVGLSWVSVDLFQ